MGHEATKPLKTGGLAVGQKSYSLTFFCYMS